MANFMILTNNPLVEGKYPAVSTRVAGGVADVFAAARDKIHIGAALMNHPLSGSIKPNESPYKSLVLTNPAGSVDFDSLKLIEGAKEVLDKLPRRDRQLPEQALEDFMVIDLDLLDSAMAALHARYHM